MLAGAFPHGARSSRRIAQIGRADQDVLDTDVLWQRGHKDDDRGNIPWLEHPGSILSTRRHGSAVEERRGGLARRNGRSADVVLALLKVDRLRDRKSTRLNSSHLGISYAVF